MRGFSSLLFVLYLILGLYLINYGLGIVNLSILASVDKWIVLLGGIFLIWGAFNHYRLNRYSY